LHKTRETPNFKIHQNSLNVMNLITGKKYFFVDRCKPAQTGYFQSLPHFLDCTSEKKFVGCRIIRFNVTFPGFYFSRLIFYSSLSVDDQLLIILYPCVSVQPNREVVINLIPFHRCLLNKPNSLSYFFLRKYTQRSSLSFS
jgi:hypothetical protein